MDGEGTGAEDNLDVGGIDGGDVQVGNTVWVIVG